MNSEVIKLFPEENYYAQCNECGSIEWNLRTDGLGLAWGRLLGSECAECGVFIAWEVLEEESE